MHTLARLRRACRSPRLFARGLNRAAHRRLGTRSENPEGIDVFAADWDTLVVLDACRYDMFEQVNDIDGELTARQSKASATTEWLEANVSGRDLRDTVYVTANPQLERNRDRLDVRFHHVENVWIDEGWDEDTGTVLADDVTRAAIEARKTYPHKRLVVHYMQPHYPFVRSETRFDKQHLATVDDDHDAAGGENVWNQKFLGHLDVSRDRIWNMYVDNLEYVLEHVEDLLAVETGKTVITSDHGNFVGERAFPIPIREYGHPRGLYDEELVSVPWLELQRGDRPTIHSGSEESADAVDSTMVSDRLRALGYRE